MATLFSIGHGTRPVGELISMLGDVEVERLVDVRSAPGSRRNPQFSRGDLAATLAGAGIAYVWRKDLGGWRRARADSPNTALRSSAFRGYADYMLTDEFEQGLRWLVDTSREARTAFMCAETLWWRCHRRMISDALAARGIEVIHLIRPGKAEPHRLSDEARPIDGRLVYDVG